MNQRACNKGDVKTLSVRHPNQDLKNVQAISVQHTWKHNTSVIPVASMQTKTDILSVIQYPCKVGASVANSWTKFEGSPIPLWNGLKTCQHFNWNPLVFFTVKMKARLLLTHVRTKNSQYATKCVSAAKESDVKLAMCIKLSRKLSRDGSAYASSSYVRLFVPTLVT